MTKQELKQIIRETIEEVGLFTPQSSEVSNLVGAEVIRANKDPNTGEVVLDLVKDNKRYTAVLK